MFRNFWCVFGGFKKEKVTVSKEIRKTGFTSRTEANHMSNIAHRTRRLRSSKSHFQRNKSSSIIILSSIDISYMGIYIPNYVQLMCN